MADVNLKDAGMVIKHGGGIILLSECDDAGGTVSADQTTLPFIEVTEFIDEVSETIYRDETGNQIKKVYEDRVVQMNATLMQTDQATIDFIKAASTKYYQLYYKMSKTGEMNAKTQELFGAICQITPSIRVRSGEKRIPISILFLENQKAITITAPNTTYGAIETDNVVIAANGYYKIVEN